MIDTHSHLFDLAFKEDLEDCIKRCQENGIDKILLVGFSYETNRAAQELAKKYSLFYPTAGLHPSEARPSYLEDLKELKQFIINHHVYAIGECGLDYHYGNENSELQKALFRGQIELAIQFDLPLIIHLRDATMDAYQIVKEYQGKVRGVMHCYSGSLEMAQNWIKLGFLISLGGPVTFKNAKESKRVAEGIDLDHLLIETDCPYLAPTPFRGQRNESSYVRYVCKEIAAIKGIEEAVVEQKTAQNAIRLFGLED